LTDSEAREFYLKGLRRSFLKLLLIVLGLLPLIPLMWGSPFVVLPLFVLTVIAALFLSLLKPWV